MGSADPHIIRDYFVPSEPMSMTTTIKGIMYSTVPPTLTITTDRQIYKGADSMASHPSRELHATPEYKIKMIFDKEQEPIMQSIAAQLKSLHTHFGMNGYIDLAAAYVQSIRNNHYENDYLQYPLVTIFNDFGSEEEKSMLLAAILAYGGYDTALLTFSDNHYGVGIKSTQPDKYPLTNGYAVIETTYPTKIGTTHRNTEAIVSKVGTGKALYLEGNIISP